MGISGTGGIVAGGPIFSDSATALNKIGARMRDERHDRTYRYALAGSGANLVAGNVIQNSADDIQNRNMTPATGAIGDTSISVTLGSTLAAANKFAGGIAIISTTAGIGYSYGISGHGALTASTAGQVVYLDEAVQVALASGTSKVDFEEHPYSNVIQAPVTTATGVPVGVATYIITLSQYGWLQTWGPCGVLITGTPAIGALLTGTGAAAGAAAIWSSTLSVIGRAMVLGVDQKVKAVYLTIAN